MVTEVRKTVLRWMLVVGATVDDARDFMGDARKLAVPDDIWPPDETFAAEFFAVDAVPSGVGVDVVVVTAAAAKSPGWRDTVGSRGAVLWVER